MQQAQTGQKRFFAGEGKHGGTEEEETMTSESGAVTGESTGGKAHSGDAAVSLFVHGREDEARAN